VPCCCQGCCGWLLSEPCGPKTCCQKHRCMTQTDRQHTQVQVSDRAELHPKLAVCLFVRAAYAVVTFDACRCEREQPGQQVLLLQAHAHMHTCTEAHTHYRQGPLLAATCLRQVGVSPLQVEILSHGPLGRLKDKKGQKKLNKTGVVFVLRHTHPAPALNPITAAGLRRTPQANSSTPKPLIALTGWFALAVVAPPSLSTKLTCTRCLQLEKYLQGRSPQQCTPLPRHKGQQLACSRHTQQVDNMSGHKCDTPG
jgi:hypothetical protein